MCVLKFIVFSSLTISVKHFSPLGSDLRCADCNSFISQLIILIKLLNAALKFSKRVSPVVAGGDKTKGKGWNNAAAMNI